MVWTFWKYGGGERGASGREKRARASSVIAIAGLVGVHHLSQAMRMTVTADRAGGRARLQLIRVWIVLYAFVGSQLAWTMRPFFGARELPFELFRDLGGNFYANVTASIGELLGFVIVR